MNESVSATEEVVAPQPKCPLSKLPYFVSPVTLVHSCSRSTWMSVSCQKEDSAMTAVHNQSTQAIPLPKSAAQVTQPARALDGNAAGWHAA